MKLGLSRVLVFVVVVFAAGFGLGACAHLEPEHIITPATRVTCILLRAFVDTGKLEEVCATAEELAPLVEEIIAEREATPPQDQKASAALVAFSLPAPARRVPRRRCASWTYLGGSDSGPGDEGGRSRDDGGSDGGDDGGERRDGGRERIDGGRSPGKP
jgi:hypothetical protein